MSIASVYALSTFAYNALQRAVNVNISFYRTLYTGTFCVSRTL